MYTDALLNSLFKCSNISTLAFYFSTPSNENAVSISWSSNYIDCAFIYGNILQYSVKYYLIELWLVKKY